MFSSTTIASSITMPTIRTSASIVTLLSVKSSALIIAKVEMTDAGIATPAMMRGAPVAHEQQHHQAGEHAAEQEVDVDLVQRLRDVARLILDDLDAARRRGTWLRTRSRLALTASIAATVLKPDWRRTSRTTVGAPLRQRERSLLLHAVLGPADVADPDRRAVDGLDHQVVELARIDDPSERAQGLLPSVRGDVAAGEVGVLARERGADVADRDPVGGQAVRVDPDVDGPLLPTEDDHFPDSLGAFQ